MTTQEQPTESAQEWVAEHARRYLATNGADGHDWRNGAPTLLLTVRGRTSGQLRRTVLIYGRYGDSYLVVASNGGAPDHPQWYKNLAADPEVEVQVRAEVFAAKARTASPDERERLWPTMTAVWPDYDAYQTKTDRAIPIVILERTET
jgi:deazaflavin-dependent oxidoreductase (nitroreductase family)